MKTRERIIEAADQLFYQQGFEATSFADIAGQVQISRGNFYHHFKTKDDILDAVIAKRMAHTNAMLTHWAIEGASPAERIQSFVRILLVNKNKIEKYGCPVGTLCSELAKLNHHAQKEANAIFTLFRQWLKQRFAEMGYDNAADDLALDVLVFSQGVATMFQAFQEEAFVQREVEKKCDWLQSLQKEA